MNRPAFEAYVETQLAPTLQPGSVVILDNLAVHKSRSDQVVHEQVGLLNILRYGDRETMLVRPPAGSEKAFQLLMLGQSMVPMLQRFYLVIAILVRNGSGTLSRGRLEVLCQQSAERLSLIFGLHSPDFFNKTLFHDFIRTLQDLNVLRRNAEGFIEFDEDIKSIGADARLVLGEEIRHSILSLTVIEEDNQDQ